MEAWRERKQQKQEREAKAGERLAAGAGLSDDANLMPDKDLEPAEKARRAERREARMYAELQAESILGLPPDRRFAEIMKMSADERRALVQAIGEDQRARLMREFTPQQREALMSLVGPPGAVIANELQQAKILRAAYSQRQLEEVMTDFWFNHFNVFIGKGPDRYLVSSYERDAIRPRALGKFKDLLEATAKSPAMLFYLDNWQSAGPKSDVALGRVRGRDRFAFGPFLMGEPQMGRRRQRRFGDAGFGRGDLYPNRGIRGGFPPPRPTPQQGRPQGQARRPAGLNENYARELMELHTLGVNGGYTQKDVTEVARVFTGWTIKDPRQGGEFAFDERRHEPGSKVVLGQKISENGEKEGLKVLEMLSRHPSTARFISRKLAMRFVSDNPPDALVERMAQTFLKSDGDIRQVLRALFKSPEFWAPEAYRAKVKTPLEFVVSAIRATGLDVANAQPLAQALNRMGMPLYGMQPPTGYSMKAEAWVNSAALLNRMNFSLALAGGKLNGISFEPQNLLGERPVPEDAERALDLLSDALLSGDVSPQTRDTIRKQLTDPEVTRQVARSGGVPNIGLMAGLLIGSPEFQRR